MRYETEIVWTMELGRHMKYLREQSVRAVAVPRGATLIAYSLAKQGPVRVWFLLNNPSEGLTTPPSWDRGYFISPESIRPRKPSKPWNPDTRVPAVARQQWQRLQGRSFWWMPIVRLLRWWKR